MTGRAEPRCSDAARTRGDALPGTASTVRAWLLLEDPGPWGHQAWRDARLPDNLGPDLLAAAARTRVRPLLIRRPLGRAGSLHGTERRVFAAWSRPGEAAMVTTTLTDPRDLLALDLTALGSGRLPHWEPTDEPFFGVCTHGRHDACCAIRGRPVAQALAVAEPEATWEVSHIGGDRFAANLLVLPAGLYFGGLDPGSIGRVVETFRRGEIDLGHFRGRSGWPMPVQVAEDALRHHLGYAARRGLRWCGTEARGDARLVTFELEGLRWVVDVARVDAAPALLTCSALQAQPSVVWRAGAVRSA